MAVASLLRSSVSSNPLSAFKNANVLSKIHCPRTLSSVLNVSGSRRLVQKSKAAMNAVSLEDHLNNIKSQNDEGFCNMHESDNIKAALQLYAILETICDRIEVHYNVGVQRDNWNSLLLNSVNMITLAATTMAGVAAALVHDGKTSVFALKLSSTLLFSAATWMSLVMNKIQPSQLAEEQRNATRLFRQLQAQIQTSIAVGNPTEEDVNSAIDKILALDEAYPLALLGGAMLEKFPSKFEPAIWWHSKTESSSSSSPPPPELKKSLMSSTEMKTNGWSEELEMEMSEIIEVVKRKDVEDYERLGNLALKMNKVMAISGPLLTGIAALGSAIFLENNDNNGTVVVPIVAGAMASVVNAFEHGGQVGMVLDMYRYCAGFFKLLEETTEATLQEKNCDRRENGEMFEMKMALMLGRSVSQLRELASKSAFCRTQGAEVDEFASKLF